MTKIVILEDNIHIASYYKEILIDAGYEVKCASNDKQFLQVYQKEKPDLIILDIKLNKSELSGLEIFELMIKKRLLDSKVIILSGEATRSEIARAMQLGAYTFIEKSGDFDIDKFLTDIKQAINLKKQEEQNVTLKQDYEAIKTKLIETMPLIGNCPQIKEIRDKIKKFAQADIDVLIIGETGTGKEVVANNLYWQSKRIGKPFMKVNAGGLTESLIESELYGHKRGSFTGAICDKKGFFEQANGGTLFLDEISNLSLVAQSKILRTIENREISIIGGKTKIIDVKMIFASNKDLRDLVENNTFRDDLFFRMDGNIIYLPPLRDRGNDILLFMDHFLKLFSYKYSVPIEVDLNDLKNLFLMYSWPGNIRELEKYCETAFILNSHINNKILVKEFEKKRYGFIRNCSIKDQDMDDSNYQKVMDTFEKRYLTHQLQIANYRVTKLAEKFNLDRSTLYKKFKKLDIKY